MIWILGTLSLGLAGLACVLLSQLIKTRNETKQLNWQAEHDPLTKLPNRINFEKQADELIEKAEFHFNPHAMLYVDLDQFKLINDTFGVAVANDLLFKICEELKAELRESDVLARLGSDKFGVLMIDCELDEASNQIHQRTFNKKYWKK